jgi:pyridoxine/pyridoxamine 5'-phosphate oxidase
MSEKKKRGRPSRPASEHKAIYQFRFRPDLASRFERWVADQSPRVSKTATVEASIEEYLEKRGY